MGREKLLASFFSVYRLLSGVGIALLKVVIRDVK